MRTITVNLDKFKPRDYQLNFLRAFESGKYKRFMLIWPRRAGKDYTALNALVRAAIQRIGTYYIVYPTFSQGRRCIWDAITNDGIRFRDMIPPELVLKTNEQLMRISLVNGSQIQIVGSDNYDALVGVNLAGAIFSEYAIQDPRGYLFLRPSLVANNGFVIFISTPRGKNSLFDLYQIAIANKDWYVSHLTVDDTKHITPEVIQKEKDEGVMSDDLIQQEYYCSFSQGVEGSYYSKYVDKARAEDRIGIVPWEPAYKVHTAWDLGPSRDDTAIIFFQEIGQTIRIIDCYSNTKQGFEHYATVLTAKPYIYGKHIAPFDIAVFEMGTGMTRYEKARSLGIEFTVAPPPAKIDRMDGIEAVRSTFGRLWIDSRKCEKLIKAIENYRQEWDAKKNVYKLNPLHDWSSHYADSLRYLCISLDKIRPGMSQADIDRKYKEKLYGYDLPKEFVQPHDRYNTNQFNGSNGFKGY